MATIKQPGNPQTTISNLEESHDSQNEPPLKDRIQPQLHSQQKHNHDASGSRSTTTSPPGSASGSGSGSGTGTLQSRPQPKASFTTSLVNKDHVDLILLACAFCAGLIDSSMFVAYTTFVSMQTGNTIFIALAISNQGPRPSAWYRPFLAVLCFIIGAVFFSRLFQHLGSPQRRVTLVLNFAIQTLFVLISAAITQSGAINADVPPTLAEEVYGLSHVPICLLAFQSAGQITASRALEVGELPTVVITSLLCDLFSDANVLALPLGRNVKRNRRLAGFCLTFLGAVIGGWMARRLGSIVAALWFAAAVKACMTVAWVFWPEEKVKQKNAV